MVTPNKGRVVDMSKAIVLLSGGLDSTVALAIAISKGRDCQAISFNYQQRHLCELEAASAIAAHYQVSHRIFSINPAAFSTSSLVSDIDIPQNRTFEQMQAAGIPNTYVPARNTLFLAYATACAELASAKEIYVGFNAMDRSGYPDCRPEFVRAYQNLINVATKQALEDGPPSIITPLIDCNKAQIIKQGLALQAPLHLSWSCYSPPKDKTPCLRCDACMLRQEGFDLAAKGT